MHQFNKEHSIQEILNAFKTIDQQRSTFNVVFYQRLAGILKIHAPQIFKSEKLNEVLETFAHQLQNVTESIIDKDFSYPAYRLEEELTKVANLAAREFSAGNYKPLLEAIFPVTKALMVECNARVFDLSGSGFRLMEYHAKLYSQSLVAAISNLEMQ